ncbi:agamous-like MADS-box protein AGL104 isoform X1 [Ziziphus jujuba]|uniref:Agamous-like MADS-box protein AGL104 isoform X1 n=1 Tax=Ziziphus jujuba TaxID=326968 RepID=A0A6P3ZZP1_ZIZJJ|nr:agamous-like MADS-box protein AGL104 isoform X1 [Ziziphus jujuba]
MEALQEKLQQVSQRHQKAQEKMKIYNPDLKNITSVHEAQVYQQFLTDSLRHVEKLKAELLGKQIMVQESGTVEVISPNIKNMGLMTEGSAEASRNRNSTANDHDQPKTT